MPPLEGFILLDRDTTRLNLASYAAHQEKVDRLVKQRGMAPSIKTKRRR